MTQAISALSTYPDRIRSDGSGALEIKRDGVSPSQALRDCPMRASKAGQHSPAGRKPGAGRALRGQGIGSILCARRLLSIRAKSPISVITWRRAATTRRAGRRRFPGVGGRGRRRRLPPLGGSRRDATRRLHVEALVRIDHNVMPCLAGSVLRSYLHRRMSSLPNQTCRRDCR